MLLLAAGCRAASTPESTVREFVYARRQGNEKRAAELTVEGDLADFMGGEDFLSRSEISVEVSAAELQGDRAVVGVQYGLGEQWLEVPYVCRREGTRWKVSLRETESLWLEQNPEVEAPEEERSTHEPSAGQGG